MNIILRTIMVLNNVDAANSAIRNINTSIKYLVEIANVPKDKKDEYKKRAETFTRNISEFLKNKDNKPQEEVHFAIEQERDRALKEIEFVTRKTEYVYEPYYVEIETRNPNDLARITTLEAEKRALQLQITVLERDKNQVEIRLRQVEEEKKNLEATNQQLTNARNVIVNQLAAINNQLQNKTAEITNLNTRRAQLEAEIAQLTTNNGQLNVSNTQLVNDNRQLEGKLAQLNAEHKTINEQITQLTNNNTQLTNNNEQLNTQNTQLTSNNMRRTMQITQLNAQNTQLTNNNMQLNTQNTQLAIENAQLTNNNTQLTNNNTQLTNNNEQLNAQNTQLTNNNEQLNAQNTQLNTQNTQLTNNNTQLNAQLAIENARLNAAQDAIRDVVAYKNEVDNKIQTMQAELLARNNDAGIINELNAKLQRAKDESDQLERTNMNLQRELVSEKVLSDEKLKLESQLRDINERINMIQAQNVVYDKTIANLNENLTRINNELIEVKAENVRLASANIKQQKEIADCKQSKESIITELEKKMHAQREAYENDFANAASDVNRINQEKDADVNEREEEYKKSSIQLQGELMRAGQQIEDIKAQISDLENINAQLREANNGCEQELDVLRNSKLDFQTRHDELNKKLNKSYDDIKNLTADAIKFKTDANDAKNSLLSNLSNDNTANIRLTQENKRLNQAIKESENIKVANANLSKQIENLNNEIARITAAKNALAATNVDLLKQNASLKTEVLNTQNTLNEMAANSKNCAARLDEYKQLYYAETQRLTSEIRESKVVIDAANKRLTEASKIIATRDTTATKLNNSIMAINVELKNALTRVSDMDAINESLRNSLMEQIKIAEKSFSLLDGARKLSEVEAAQIHELFTEQAELHNMFKNKRTERTPIRNEELKEINDRIHRIQDAMAKFRENHPKKSITEGGAESFSVIGMIICFAILLIIAILFLIKKAFLKDGIIHVQIRSDNILS